MRFGNWRVAAFGLALATVGFIQGQARAGDLFSHGHVIPSEAPAYDIRTGGEFYAPPVPYGHYAKDPLGHIHDTLGVAKGSLLGVFAKHGLGGGCSGPGCGLGHGGLGNGGLGHGGHGHGHGGMGGDGHAGHGHAAGLGNGGLGGAGLGHGCDGCGNGASGGGLGFGNPFRDGDGCGQGKAGHGHKSKVKGCSDCGQPGIAVSGPLGSSQGGMSGPVAGSGQHIVGMGDPCGDPGCKLFKGHGGHGMNGRDGNCGGCGRRGCGGGCGLLGGSRDGNCGGCGRQGCGGGCGLLGGLRNGACGGCGRQGCGGACGLLGGLRNKLCGMCGGAGCKACLAGAKAKLLGLFHHDKVKYFVGAGGPVPLTPGYVPYVVTTRSPRDFLSFPPYTP